MHYQHRYHAGNFADVFKHVLLCGLLEALGRKPAPWCYLESHAGEGAYDLGDETARRTGEWQGGIGRLWPGAAGLPEAFLRTVQALNPGGALRHYPGSPLFAQAVARADDRLVLCEKAPAVATLLRARLAGDRRAAVHERDGYEIAALLPPVQKRGLVLIDPPFERVDEFDALAGLAERALARFGHGVYALWHPVKNRHASARGVRRLGARAGRPWLHATLDTGAADAGQMHACGLVVVNPPFGFERDCVRWLALLADRLGESSRAAFSCEMH